MTLRALPYANALAQKVALWKGYVERLTQRHYQAYVCALTQSTSTRSSTLRTRRCSVAEEVRGTAYAVDGAIHRAANDPRFLEECRKHNVCLEAHTGVCDGRGQADQRVQFAVQGRDSHSGVRRTTNAAPSVRRRAQLTRLSAGRGRIARAAPGRVPQFAAGRHRRGPAQHCTSRVSRRRSLRSRPACTATPFGTRPTPRSSRSRRSSRARAAASSTSSSFAVSRSPTCRSTRSARLHTFPSG